MILFNIIKRNIGKLYSFVFAFPDLWIDILSDRVDFYKVLNTQQKRKFHRCLQAFIFSKNFIGVDGIIISDYHRVIIGASAIRLILNLSLKHYDHLKLIIVYPERINQKSYEQALGMVDESGFIRLSWNDVLDGLKDNSDGTCTATHEFAHILDIGDRKFDGIPNISSNVNYEPWVEVLIKTLNVLSRESNMLAYLINKYDISDISEFFAYFTEAFFELPQLLFNCAPDIYHQLSMIYKQDPRQYSKDL